MHKITKGLKKKKKGKKSKHKEDELFKPEELEAYRREHQQQQQPAESSENSAPKASGENEEWKKFNALTAGVDSILKKTQGDLNRIKSTSFFQRVPPPSEVKAEEKEAEEQAQKQQELERNEVDSFVTELESAIVPVSDSESEEEEDEDDIFDTSYLDAIAAGEVKLAYIPESPTEQQQGDDPFDTSIAERAILGPASDKKGRKLVPLGSAVEVLTGRVQAPTCVPTKRPSTRRQILKEKDLLLGSFDDNANNLEDATTKDVTSPPKTLLDDDAPLPLSDEPIDLSKTLHQIKSPALTPKEEIKTEFISHDIVAEFDVISKEKTPEDEDDKEFELLAAESLSKPIVATIPSAPPQTPIVLDPSLNDNWNAFADDNNTLKGFDESNVVEDDPFDTTFAENILPGKVELKLIEKEILNNDDDFDFNPRADEKLSQLIQNKVSIQVTDPSGERESVSSLDRISESELNVIQHSHRDLLGGSITDLSKLDDQPLKPSEVIDENYIEYSDPFDTSIVDIATAPGQVELKFLEKELLSDIKVNSTDCLEDEDFDPRAEEFKTNVTNNNNFSHRKVSFELPLGTLKQDLLTTGAEETLKINKPLTPYYARENSIPEALIAPNEEEEEEEEEDPFDTSFVPSLAPGKVELKVIETELFATNIPHSITDQDFDPRDEKQVVIAKVIQEINKPIEEKFVEQPVPEPIDLLSADNTVDAKVLTPSASIEEIAYVDPFDTSIASNILPGKTELKLLETELIHSTVPTLKTVLSDPDFNPRETDAPVIKTKKAEEVNLLETASDAVNVRPLTPLIDNKVSFELDESDIDPFDTSIANNIAPGKAELKLLENELI